MGFMSDTEIDLEGSDLGADSPPASPRAASTHAEAIAESLRGAGQDFNGNVVRDYVSLCCREFELTDTDKDDALKTSQLNLHLIAVRQYIRVVALTHNVNQLLSESFLESAEFKDHVTRRIQATFLDAVVPTYVRGCTPRLIQHMQENPASWRIPPIVHAHFLNSKVFRKAVAAVASNFRGDMRRKIQKSMRDNLDIGALAKKLCVKGYQPTDEHWRRFALLRCYMGDWEKLPCRPGKGRGVSFWAYIDSKLDKLQVHCARPTKAETQATIKLLLKANLKDDQQRYTGPTSGRIKLPARIHLPEWQRDHAKAVNDMSEYTIDANMDDDIDEDDSIDNPEGSSDAQVPRHSEPNVQESHEDDTGAENSPGHEASSETLQVNGTSAGAEHQVGGIRTGRVLVPETQSQGGTQLVPSQVANRGVMTPDGLDLLPSLDTQSTQPSFVPGTPRPSMPVEDPQTPGSSGSASSQAAPSGRTAGGLVDRRQRLTYSSPSPLARPGSSSTSRTRRS